MRINYNLSAMITNSQLFRNEKNQQSAAERLASGLKINHAKDDPAGMAISNKMDVQIEGIRQASRNSSDGISILETADSSLNEVTNIIQRMRELAVQAASDTNQIEDREAIQVEIDSLSEEIDRVSTNTEFNKKVLLDGSLSRRSYTNNRKVSVTNVGSGVPTNKYGVTIVHDARQAVFRGAFSDTADLTVDGAKMGAQTRLQEIDDTFTANHKLRSEAAGKVTINGQIIEFKGGESYEEIYQKLREGAEIVDVTCVATISDRSYMDATYHTLVGSATYPDASGKYEDTAGYMPDPNGYAPIDTLVFVSKDYGSSEKLNISCDNALLATALGLARQAGIDKKLAHEATAAGTKTSPAEIKCYRSTDIFLTDMRSPVVLLDKSNQDHKKYFDDPTIANMKMPALYGGEVIDLEATDPVKGIEYEDYLMKFYDKEDYLPADLAGKIEVNGGTPVEIEKGFTAEKVFEKIKEACGSEVDVFLTDDVRSSNYTILNEEYNYSQALVFKSKSTGTELSVAVDNPRLALMLGLPVCEWSVSGHDCVADFTDDPTTPEMDRIGFSNSASITTKGNKITVTDKNGFELELEAEKKTCGTFYSDWSATGRINHDYTMSLGDAADSLSDYFGYGNYSDYIYSKKVGEGEQQITVTNDIDVVADVTGYGMMTVHTGANEDQIIDMDIPKVDCKSLDIDGLNVRSGWTADKALAKLDAALIKLNGVRSRLGAYQNRLESTVASLDANDEDLTAAVSRIRDVDMAAETTEYTQHTILVQAATSVLAQANELPQQALQLIQ